MKSLDQLVAEISAWQAKTFPKATKASLLEHLRREFEELKQNPSDEEEMADVFFLLLALVNQYGYDLRELVENKLDINLARVWKEPDEHGVVEHERDDDYIDAEGKRHSSVVYNSPPNPDNNLRYKVSIRDLEDNKKKFHGLDGETDTAWKLRMKLDDEMPG